MKTIFDIGMNLGEDTAYYLHKGYRVIAVEANQELCEGAIKRFANEIADNRLIIINKGIADKHGFQDFYINKNVSQWSSFIKDVGARQNSPYEVKQIECVTIASIIAEYGTPFYCKIDIEQYDVFCLDSLLTAPECYRPPYISVEADNTMLLDKMYELGYRKFKMICQGYIHEQNTPDWSFPEGSSGRFGEDSPGKWMDIQAVKKLFLGPHREFCWYDFHAKVS